MRYGDDARGRAIASPGKKIQRQRESDAPRSNQRNGTVRTSQPRRSKCVRFIGVNEVHLSISDKAPDRKRGGTPSPPPADAVSGNACILRAASQQGAAQCDQFRSMAARKQTLQEQQRLVLSSTVVLAEVHNQRAHAQALPGFGHERRVSFSPASSRPSLRYLM